MTANILPIHIQKNGLSKQAEFILGMQKGLKLDIIYQHNKLSL